MGISQYLFGVAALAGAALVGSMPAEAKSFRVVYRSHGGSDFSEPNASLINVGGTLYGTSRSGGLYNNGTVFKVDPRTGAESVVYAFTGGSDGSSPKAAMISVGDMLYSTTGGGGAYGHGTVFRIDPRTSAENVVYSFTGGGDGGTPFGALINLGDMLYGTTASGGAGNGTVFKVNPSSGAASVVHVFAGGSVGGSPNPGLINVGGMLYGTTQLGGAYTAGTVFEVNPSTGADGLVYSFKAGRDGMYPVGSLIDVGGALYGTTYNGGGSPGHGYAQCQALGHIFGCGTVFKLNPDTGAESVVYAFQGSDGADPVAGLTNVDGVLYGTTSFGGEQRDGTVFRLDPRTGALGVLHTFVHGGYDGGPQANLISVGGTLYGTTEGGGAGFGDGMVFAITP